MQNRILIHLALVLLFAFAQIGIATHSVEHIEIHLSDNHESSSESDTSDQHATDFQCPQCIAQAHADVATIDTGFDLALLNYQHVLSDNEASYLPSYSSDYFSARAPPKSI